MPSFNRVVLVGNITREIEIRYTQKVSAVAKVGMAINRTWRNEAGETKEEVTFVDVDVFGKSAENVSKYMRKGSPILVEGRLRLETWDDKESGQKRSKLGVVAESVQFLSGGERTETKATAQPSGKAESPVADDDVPF